LGLQRFLRKVSKHRLICDSEDLKGFLADADHAFEERKRVLQPQLEQEFSDEMNPTYSSMALNTLTSVFSMATEKIGSYMWTPGSTSTQGPVPPTA
jgi:hypothetical protein